MEINSEKTNGRLELIERWKASGKSIMSFCKEENLSYYTFLYWRDKLVKRNNRSGFVKIKRATRMMSNNSTCEIVFANGNRAKFSIAPQVSYLKALLS